MDKKNYRRGVGMIIINNDGRFWLGKRIGTEAWQFPQGGIDKGERVREAMYRELHEETCLLYTSPSPRDATLSRMPSSA